jgi:Ca2+-binding EF-hand superfamily protein
MLQLGSLAYSLSVKLSEIKVGELMCSVGDSPSIVTPPLVPPTGPEQRELGAMNGQGAQEISEDTINAWYETHNDEAGRGRDNEMSRREVVAFQQDGALTEDQKDIANYVFEQRKVFDTDGNGRLSREEFHSAVRAAEANVDLPEGDESAQSGKVHEFYERYNDEAAAGRDNEMSRREIEAFSDDADLGGEDRAIAQYILDNRSDLDTDNNGRLSRDEFVAAFDAAVAQYLDPVAPPPESNPIGSTNPPSNAERIVWGGEEVSMWEITQQNANDSGIADGADAFLVTVNDTSISRVEDMAEEYGFNVVETAGKSDAGVLFLRPTSDSDVEGLSRIINFGKTTIVAVDEPDGKRLVPDGGGFETRPKNQMGFGTTDNTSTTGGVFHSDGGNSTIKRNGEDDVRVWDDDNMVRSFRGGWMGLEWESV